SVDPSKPTHYHRQSFPTRRSSDLRPSQNGSNCVFTQKETQINNQERITPMNQNDETQSPYAAFVGLDRSDKKINVSLQRCGRSKDRKSTRLNSSHQIISYAVFCLK